MYKRLIDNSRSTGEYKDRDGGTVECVGGHPEIDGSLMGVRKKPMFYDENLCDEGQEINFDTAPIKRFFARIDE